MKIKLENFNRSQAFAEGKDVKRLSEDFSEIIINFNEQPSRERAVM